MSKENEATHLEISRRRYDGKWCVWAPYSNVDLATRWQMVSVNESKGQAEKSIRIYTNGKQSAPDKGS